MTFRIAISIDVRDAKSRFDCVGGLDGTNANVKMIFGAIKDRAMVTVREL